MQIAPPPDFVTFHNCRYQNTPFEAKNHFFRRGPIPPIPLPDGRGTSNPQPSVLDPPTRPPELQPDLRLCVLVALHTQYIHVAHGAFRRLFCITRARKQKPPRHGRRYNNHTLQTDEEQTTVRLDTDPAHSKIYRKSQTPLR